mgnify:CR=1 FL=1
MTSDTAIVWTQDLNTGIDVLDNQHKRIVDYINQLGQYNRRTQNDLVQLFRDTGLGLSAPRCARASTAAPAHAPPRQAQGANPICAG